MRPVEGGSDDGDSSAAAPEAFEDAPFWPQQRGTAPELKADIDTESVRRLHEEFARLNRSEMSETLPVLVDGLLRPAREIVDGKPVWFWSHDRSETPDVSVCVEYRAGRVASIRRFPKAQSNAERA